MGPFYMPISAPRWDHFECLFPVGDVTEGITRVEDLPQAKVVKRSRNYKRRLCPNCGRSAYRLRTVVRRLHDLGDPISERPRDIHVTYSQHRCLGCDTYFNADMDDLALPKSGMEDNLAGVVRHPADCPGRRTSG